jgi:hypothetical protein
MEGCRRNLCWSNRKSTSKAKDTKWGELHAFYRSQLVAMKRPIMLKINTVTQKSWMKGSNWGDSWVKGRGRGRKPVETPTWQHISLLCCTTHSILRLSSQQNSDPRTKSNPNYFSFLHHSNAPYLSPTGPFWSKQNQSVNWDAETRAKRKATSPCLLVIPAFDRIAVL